MQWGHGLFSTVQMPVVMMHTAVLIVVLISMGTMTMLTAAVHRGVAVRVGNEGMLHW